MHSDLIEVYKKTLKLSKEQIAIIVGTLLGDGHLETSNNGRTYRLKIEHSLKQKEYVDWLYRKLENLTGEKPKTRMRDVIFPNGSKMESAKYGFATYALPSLRFYGQQFYPTPLREKTIPKLISRFLNPLVMAVWYLDDGSYKSVRHKTFIIHTHGYSRHELTRIQKAMKNLGIESSLHRQNRENGVYWRIYILSKSAIRFVQLIQPIINQVPSMKYKLGRFAVQAGY